MDATKPSETVAVLRHRLAAPRDAVWEALTVCRHLLQWMGTSDTTLVACEAEARPGGRSRYVYRRPGNRTIEVRNTYDSVERPRQFAYEETYDFSPLRIRVIAALEESQGGTILTQTLHYGSREERDQDFEGVVSSSTEAFRRLERYLEDGGVRPPEPAR